jgi:hypothetical protein
MQSFEQFALEVASLKVIPETQPRFARRAA